MLRDTIRHWLASHPKVLGFLFSCGVCITEGVRILKEGGAEGYNGP